MRDVDSLRAWAKKKYHSAHRSWLALPDFGESCLFTWPLHPPTEQEADAQLEAVAQWIAQWRRAKLPRGCVTGWKTVRWRARGVQQMPTQVQVNGASSLAALAGFASEWRRAVNVAEQLYQAWPTCEDLNNALPKLARELWEFDEDEIKRLIAVVNWLVEHPTSGMYPRQLPVQGVDSKWLEHHRGIVEKLKAALSDSPDLGLASLPERFSVRVLDESVRGVRTGEPHLFSAPASELARLAWTPDWVLVVENYQTFAALPKLSGVVAVFGKGKNAPDLAVVPWIYEAPHLLYWGDLDTHGMRILGLTRKAIPQTESILMDEATLAHFITLAVIEPKPFTGQISHLTEAELRALAQLREDNLRLEQERIDMAFASAALQNRIEAESKLTSRGTSST
ncbi:MAG: DUF3322 domain-containing protein [Coriobacteriia bacterium]|nr:DUF3322 domain-containing protein [Coriobacteriia bacterium]